MVEKIKRVKAIRDFFQSDGGKKVSMTEMKDLMKDRESYYELADLAAKAEGKVIDA